MIQENNKIKDDAQSLQMAVSFQLRVLNMIKEHVGLDLELCDYFTGVKEHNGKKYFNILLKERTSESKEYDLLKKYSDKYKLLSFEPNGVNRIAVIIN